MLTRHGAANSPQPNGTPGLGAPNGVAMPGQGMPHQGAVGVPNGVHLPPPQPSKPLYDHVNRSPGRGEYSWLFDDLEYKLT
jgi:hypothetical protein